MPDVAGPVVSGAVRDPRRRQRPAVGTDASGDGPSSRGPLRSWRSAPASAPPAIPGSSHATSDLIAFTDDDVVVHPGWIGAIREAFVDRGVMAVTGLVLPAELATAAQYAFQTDVLGWGWGYRALDFDRTFFDATKDVGVPAWRLGAGANMAFRREAFDRVGLFDERLGAGASGCSEDSELWYRLLAEGHRCRYWPSAVVLHHHRADWDGLRHQMYSYMRGHVAALFVQFERYRHWGNVYRAFVALPWYLATLAFHTGKRWFARQFYDPRDGAVPQPGRDMSSTPGHRRIAARPRRAAPGRALAARAQDRRDPDLADREQAPACADRAGERGRLRTIARPLRPARRRRVTSKGALRPRAAGDPRRRQLAGAGDEGGGARRAALRAARRGTSIEDIEGKRYVDWVLSWGPLVFGHADPEASWRS